MKRPSRSASLAAALALFVHLGASSCRKGAAPDGAAPVAAKKADSLFIAEGPAVVPEDSESDFGSMGISRIYVVGASLSATGKITPFPPPPNRIVRPAVFVLMGEPGAEDAIGPSSGEPWAIALQKIIQEARSWASIVGFHLHVVASPAKAEAIGELLGQLKTRLNLPVSVVVPGDAPAASWKPLVGKADELLVLTFGRRPETNDRMGRELPEAEARAFPVPFRVLFVLGGYGRIGADQKGRRISDGEVDRLSEERDLDFEFGSVLSAEPGNIYKFVLRPGADAARSSLGKDGSAAQFHLLALSDLLKQIAAVGRWGGAPLLGRVFLVDGVPKDGHLLGYPAVRAILTGKPLDPSLTVETVPRPSGKGYSEFSLRVSNPAPSPSELSHFDNWLKLRVEGGTFVSVSPGDFDRFELWGGDGAGASQAPFGRATVTKLFENFFASEETNEVGPIRVWGATPKVTFTYQLVLPDGRSVKGAETEVALAPPEPPKEEEKPRLGRSKR